MDALNASHVIAELGLIKLELVNLRKELAQLREQQAPVYHVTLPTDDQRTSAVEKFLADYAAKSKAAG